MDNDDDDQAAADSNPMSVATIDGGHPMAGKVRSATQDDWQIMRCCSHLICCLYNRSVEVENAVVTVLSDERSRIRTGID